MEICQKATFQPQHYYPQYQPYQHHPHNYHHHYQQQPSQNYMESNYVCASEIRNRKRSINLANIYQYAPQASALQAWLAALRTSTEIESLNALQAKSVATTAESFEALSIRNAQINVQQIRRQSSAIIDELDSLIDSLPIDCADGARYLGAIFRRVVDSIGALVSICRRKGCDHAIADRALSAEVMTHAERTLAVICGDQDGAQINNVEIEAGVRKLKETFGELIDVSIKKECSILVGSLNRSSCGAGSGGYLCVKWSLLALWQLTANDPYMCRLLLAASDRPPIIRYLLDIVLLTPNRFDRNNSRHSSSIITNCELAQIKAAALRVLTYLCSNRDAIGATLCEIGENRQCLSAIASLRASSSSIDGDGEDGDHDQNNHHHVIDSLRKEAVGLLVQLTTPFIDSSPNNSNNSDDAIDKDLINEIVFCLTEIVRSLLASFASPQSKQILLMATAALANITFRETDSIVKHETLSVLIKIEKQYSAANFDNNGSSDDNGGDGDDLLLRDQMITLLANVAASDALEVVRSGGLIYVLDALHNHRFSSPSSSSGSSSNRQGEADHQHQSDEDLMERRAQSYAKIQQKIAVALARLASHRSAAKIIVRLNGIDRLVRWCRHARERYFSDTVLLASIAALKRLSCAIGREPFEALRATDLIDRKLQQSFMQYSVHHVSLV